MTTSYTMLALLLSPALQMHQHIAAAYLDRESMSRRHEIEKDNRIDGAEQAIVHPGGVPRRTAKARANWHQPPQFH